jgi:pimeloyl-ACP methyl ester carboxylesterase
MIVTVGAAVRIPAGTVVLDADLALPEAAAALVIFAHGSGSSRFSERNRFVARALHASGFGTLLLDLLTPNEDRIDAFTAEYRFDVERLAARVVAAIDWAASDARTRSMPVMLFGASTGAAAALVAAAARPDRVAAVISRGGRPDLAASALAQVRAPVLLIVGGEDTEVIALNRRAAAKLPARADIEIVPGATHLFEEPGTLERVAALASAFCRRHADGGV